MILGVDVGRNMGLCLMNMDGKLKYSQNLRFKTLETFYDHILKIIMESPIKGIVTCRPVRHYKVIQFHNRLIAILELLAEMNDIAYFEYTDSECKKVVIGKGNAKKDEIKKALSEYGDLTEHEYDSIMFCLTVLEQLSPQKD